MAFGTAFVPGAFLALMKLVSVGRAPYSEHEIAMPVATWSVDVSKTTGGWLEKAENANPARNEPQGKVRCKRNADDGLVDRLHRLPSPPTAGVGRAFGPHGLRGSEPDGYDSGDRGGL